MRVLFPAPIKCAGQIRCCESIRYVRSVVVQLTRLPNDRHELRVDLPRRAGHELAHDGGEPAVVVEHGLPRRRVPPEPEPGRVLVLHQLGGVLGLGPRRLEDLAQGVHHGRVCLLVGLAIPIKRHKKFRRRYSERTVAAPGLSGNSPSHCAWGMQHPFWPAWLTEGEVVALKTGQLPIML